MTESGVSSEDFLGNPLSPLPASALADVNDFLRGFLGYLPCAVNMLVRIDDYADLCLPNAYAALLHMFAETPDAPVNAKPYVQLALAAAEDAHPREAMIATIAGAWVEDRIDDALTTAKDVLAAYPRDLVTLKLAQYFLFNRGDALGMLQCAMLCRDAAADSAYFHAMLAFAYEQSHLLEHAEDAARTALAIDPHEPWAHHAIAHVYLTQGRIDEGADFMAGVADSWSGLNSFMYTHNWWHLALFRLSQGQGQAVLDIYDQHVWGREKSYSQDQIGAVSMLARMEFAGLDVGDRWQDPVDHIVARGRDVVQPFLTLQYLYGLARLQRPELTALMQAVRDRAATDTDLQRPWAAVTLPAAEAIIDYFAGRYSEAATRLAPVLPMMEAIGGSHAQRDLFEQLLIAACQAGGATIWAQQRLQQRLHATPTDVPTRQHLAWLYQKSGLSGLAEEIAP